MGNAWGHQVRELTAEEIQEQIDYGKRHFQWYEDNKPERQVSEEHLIHAERKCRISAKCQNESEYLLTYLYVTGRAGRVTYAEKPICKEHAKKYLSKPKEEEL